MKNAIILTILLAAVPCPVAKAVTYTHSLPQTTAGQNFIFTFSPVNPWNAGNGIFTVRARGDYSIDTSNEYLDWDIDGFVSGRAGPMDGGTVIQEFDYSDVEWEQSFVISGSDLNAITSDSSIVISIDLSSGVNSAINPATHFVEVELTYYASGPQTEGAVIYVDEDATGANDGSSWDDAFNYLQDGLAVAWTGGEVLVAQGIYRPDEDTANPTGTGNRMATFKLINNVEIKGGYAGYGEHDPNARDIGLYETILSGDIGTLDDNSDNCIHVFYHPEGTGLDATAVLDGFTITAGNANIGSWPATTSSGGGMYNRNSSPTVTNCTFSGNSANMTRDGIGGGGGMENCYSSSPTVINCVFIGNSAYWGGGMCNDYDSSPTVTNCTFIGNTAGSGGAGGLGNWNNSNPIVTNCTFTGNVAELGGGMRNWNCSPTVTNCILWGNTANYGPQFHNEGSPVTVSYSDVQGGWVGEGNIDIDPNFVDSENGDYHLSPDSACIDAGDPNQMPYVAPSVTREFHWAVAEPIQLNKLGINPITIVVHRFGKIYDEGFDYDIISQGPVTYLTLHLFGGADPDFTTLDGSEIFHVDYDYLINFDTDLDGNPRIVNGRIDMGAYEVQLNDPIELLDILAFDIIDLGLHRGIENSLLAKIDAAIAKLEDDNPKNDRAAIRSLRAFINDVEAQRGKKIAEEDADDLIAAIQQIIDMLTSG